MADIGSVVARTRIAVLAVVLLSGGCAHSAVKYMPYDPSFKTTDTGVVSRYMKPAPGVFYAYGNFCGPGRPFAERDSGNLARAAAIQPVDSLDRVCKVHDLCYMRFGVDASDCDALGVYATRLMFANLPMPLAVHCQFLGIELQAALAFKPTSDMGGSQLRQGMMAATAPLMGGIIVAGRASFENSGFPKEAGHCIADYGPAANAAMGIDAYALVREAERSIPKQLSDFRAEGQEFNQKKLYNEMTTLGRFLSEETCRDKADGINFGPVCPAVDVFLFARTGDVRVLSITEKRDLVPLALR